MKGSIILTKGASSLWKRLVNTDNDYICLSVTKRLQYINAQSTKNLHIQRRFAIQRQANSPQLSVVTTGIATAKINQNSLPKTSLLIARGIHGEGAGRGVPLGTGSPLPKAGDIRALSQTSATAQQQQLNPVENLEADVAEAVFNGMNTDFPCVTRNRTTGPEPEYHRVASGFHTYRHQDPFVLKWNGAVLPQVEVAYETWGELNEEGSNAVLICAGLSASSHAKSHEDNPKPGWWEKFVGPGCAVDTNKFFVICTNTLGSCYGSSGPSSINPLTNKNYGTTFPLISIEDMVRSQFLVLDHLGIDKLHASVGSSLGGMCSLMAAAMFPERVGRMVSISSCARSHPSSIAMRYLQRKTIMTDPNWNKGHYYEGTFPKMGMKLAREIATLTYRSGPEWDERFGRKRMDEMAAPSLCPTFLIESYLEYQGESFSNKFDPNSILYISKAMDLFDIADGYGSLEKGLADIICPVMVIGVQTDILFPIWQQRELAKVLQDTGNDSVTFYELNSLYGHDTFLLDLNGVGAGVKGFLETEMKERGMLTKRKAHHKKDDHNKDRISF